MRPPPPRVSTTRHGAIAVYFDSVDVSIGATTNGPTLALLCECDCDAGCCGVPAPDVGDMMLPPTTRPDRDAKPTTATLYRDLTHAPLILRLLE